MVNELCQAFELPIVSMQPSFLMNNLLKYGLSLEYLKVKYALKEQVTYYICFNF